MRMRITVSDEIGRIDEKFDSILLTRLCKEHGGINSVYDGNPVDGRHLDLAHISDRMLENYSMYEGKRHDLKAYSRPVVIFFKDGTGIIVEGTNIYGSGWQTRTRDRNGSGRLYRLSLNESATTGRPRHRMKLILVKKEKGS